MFGVIEIVTEPHRVSNARLIKTVLARLGDYRLRDELEDILCKKSPFWAPQTLTAALREALRRGWVEQLEDAYGVYYRASEAEGSE